VPAAFRVLSELCVHSIDTRPHRVMGRSRSHHPVNDRAETKLAKSVTNTGDAIRRRQSKEEEEKENAGGNSRTAEQIVNDEGKARALALRCAVTAVLEGVQIRAAARRNGIDTWCHKSCVGQGVGVGIEIWEEQHGSPRPDGVSTRYL